MNTTVKTRKRIECFRADIVLVVVFVQTELGLSLVIQCNLLCNSSRNFVEGGVTIALRETFRRVTHHVTDTIREKQFTSAVSESRNSVLLFAAVEASCFAGI